MHTAYVALHDGYLNYFLNFTNIVRLMLNSLTEKVGKVLWM